MADVPVTAKDYGEEANRIIAIIYDNYAALESKLQALIEAAEDAADQMDECTDYCSLPLRAAIAKAKEDA
jgi:uncharacterized tellurite resistance protein B-like protein